MNIIIIYYIPTSMYRIMNIIIIYYNYTYFHVLYNEYYYYIPTFDALDNEYYYFYYQLSVSTQIKATRYIDSFFNYYKNFFHFFLNSGLIIAMEKKCIFQSESN